MDLNSSVKIVVVGDSLSGKTSLINRYMNGSFEETPKNEIFGVDFKILKFNFGFRDYIIQIWDTAGLEKYRSITKSYFHSAAGVVITVDSTEPAALSKLDDWIQNIQEYLNDDLFKVTVALTKSDLERKIDMDFFKVMAERYDFKYYEVSSKSGENVDEMFDAVIHESLIFRNKMYLSKKAETFKNHEFLGINNSPTEESLSNNSGDATINLSASMQLKPGKGDRNCIC